MHSLFPTFQRCIAERFLGMESPAISCIEYIFAGHLMNKSKKSYPLDWLRLWNGISVTVSLAMFRSNSISNLVNKSEINGELVYGAGMQYSVNYDGVYAFGNVGIHFQSLRNARAIGHRRTFAAAHSVLTKLALVHAIATLLTVVYDFLTLVGEWKKHATN